MRRYMHHYKCALKLVKFSAKLPESNHASHYPSPTALSLNELLLPITPFPCPFRPSETQTLFLFFNIFKQPNEVIFSTNPYRTLNLIRILELDLFPIPNSQFPIPGTDAQQPSPHL
jgi:hypothetical protein